MAKNQSAKEIEMRKITVTLTCLLIGCGLAMVSMFTFNRYRYVDGFLFPLWYVALGLGVVSAIAVVLWKKETIKIPVSIILFIGVFFFVFIIFGSIFAHLNHFLDFHEVEEYTVVVEDTNVDIGRRRAPNEYEISITVQGETFWLDISRIQFYSLDVGDRYVVAYHKGAFNKPYYIGVGRADG